MERYKVPEKPMGVVDRVFNGARQQLKLEGVYEKYSKEIEGILTDEEFRKEQKRLWDVATLNGTINSDAAKQDKNWATQVVELIKSKIGVSVSRMDKAA